MNEQNNNNSKMNQQRTAVRQRPTSSPSPQSQRKIFNCIADDTALVAGVKRSTRNGLRQWIKNGQIRLFVPLHALEQLNLQKASTSRHAEDVQETLDWLDQATTRYPNAVTLQGGDETFQQWSEVEKFVVPRSLFSEHDHDDDEGASLERKLSNDTDAHSTAALPSPPMSPSTYATSTHQGIEGHDDAVPPGLQPLFNYILWRIHQEIDPVAALESFIFLCNDPAKANLAKGFEVRCKRLEQLRDAVGREDREFKNRQAVQHRSTQSVSSVPDQSSSKSPPTAPAAMLKPQSNVIDPDAFDRSNKASTGQPSRGGGNTSIVSQRGRGGMRGRGKNNGIGGRAAGRGLEQHTDVAPEIDPNSFERPRGGHVGHGGRKLWTPG